ncbi:MAG: 2-oxo-4-hydroxy-4-carboxy-5-ureidoimidazoline decarboxylase [Steroidobacteraceae bacterium]
MQPLNSSEDAGRRFEPAPRTMDETEFSARFGAVYEQSSWIAQRAWARGLNSTHDTVAGLSEALVAEVAQADEACQLRLIRAHPDLGGKAALAGKLTAASAREQAGAGLTACTPEQFDCLQRLNAEYTAKFGFPFVVAVTGLTREQIIDGIAERLKSDPAIERHRALSEIHRIAWFRLVQLARQPSGR